MALRKLLIANRGEIALRILRACQELNIRTVAVHSDVDADAMHVKFADESVCIGPADPRLSYLNIPAIISACEITGADAVHPGYGFLSENARFSEILDQHSITFVGPKTEHILAMGEKVRAKSIAKKLGLPVVPGSDGEVRNMEHAKRVASDLGYPVLIKAAAGGGGRGMKVARNIDELRDGLTSARMEATAAFGCGTLYIEKYLNLPRHIEVQMLCDNYGNAISLGERDCSLQRRHQKLWEESPAPHLSKEQREHISAKCVDAMSKLGYRNAGTIEFLFENDEFYFIEMNTRIQVEHPVTEMVTGVDMVRTQIEIAGGKRLSYNQSLLPPRGHSIEVRVNAENPFTSVPSPGTVDQFHPAGGIGVRVDSGLYGGYRVSPWYDSLVGKLIVHAETREAAISRLRRALNETIISGIQTTIPLFQKLVDEPDIQSGDYNIHWLSNYLNQIQD